MSEEAIEQVAQSEPTVLETPAEVAQGGSGNDFLQMVPEELREHPSLSPIKDVENLARSYVNAQRLIGADKIPVPVNPTDEDLDNIYNRLGRPESVDGYEIAVDGNIVSEMTTEAETQQRSQTEMALRKEWGDDFDARIEDAGKIAQQFGGGELLEMKLADGTKVGNHPDFIKAFAKMAEFRQSVTSEDTVSDAPSSSMMTRQSAQQEIDAIMNDKSHAYWDRKNVVGRQAAIERVQDLMGVLHGTG
jgi:uncharacterized protein YoaH (UPF0181 family)